MVSDRNLTTTQRGGSIRLPIQGHFTIKIVFISALEKPKAHIPATRQLSGAEVRSPFLDRKHSRQFTPHPCPANPARAHLFLTPTAFGFVSPA